MSDTPYYMAYENRYQKVFAAGVECWGHSPNDEVLLETLSKWVDDHQLQGKRIIEFACGEGACGVILSELGCIYHGVDISPTVVDKAKRVLEHSPNASVALLDMVRDPVTDQFHAALDVSGLHMIILDEDRKNYLRNAYNCLMNGAPMLFFNESYRRNAPTGEIKTIDEWKAITGDDYDAPQKRTVHQNGMDIDIYIPFVPARAKTKEDYIIEMGDIGFIVDDFVEMAFNEQCPYSASIFVHKPEI